MKHFLLAVFVVVLACAVPTQSATLSQLTNDFRHAIGEPDTATSVVPDSIIHTWLNLSQRKIARLNNYIVKEWDTVFAVSGQYGLPNDAVSLINVKLFAKQQWGDYANGVDSGVLPWQLVRDSNAVRAYLADVAIDPTYVDIVTSNDSLSYRLPRDFRRMMFAMGRSGARWKAMAQNPGFLIDTNVTSYFVAQSEVDSADLYVQSGQFMNDNDTIRVFYLRSPSPSVVAGTWAVKFIYAGWPSEMTTDSTECELADGLEVFVVETATEYYLRYLKDYQRAQLVWQQVRMDMGVLKGSQ